MIWIQKWLVINSKQEQIPVYKNKSKKYKMGREDIGSGGMFRGYRPGWRRRICERFVKNK
jgi:hypothetical protein